jgi:cytoskeletal protein RodZ
MKTERGNALIGIVVIIIVFLVGAVFAWNSYQIQERKNEEIRKQASIVQTIIVPPETSTSTATSTELTTSTSTSTSTIISTSTKEKVK